MAGSVRLDVPEFDAHTFLERDGDPIPPQILLRKLLGSADAVGSSWILQQSVPVPLRFRLDVGGELASLPDSAAPAVRAWIRAFRARVGGSQAT